MKVEKKDKAAEIFLRLIPDSILTPLKSFFLIETRSNSTRAKIF